MNNFAIKNLPSHNRKACMIGPPSWQDTSSNNSSSANRILWYAVDHRIYLDITTTIHILAFIYCIKQQLRWWWPAHNINFYNELQLLAINRLKVVQTQNKEMQLCNNSENTHKVTKEFVYKKRIYTKAESNYVSYA